MDVRKFCKATVFSLSVFTLVFMAGCTINPATGEKEFNGLMSPQQEESIGASQHQDIIKQYGGVYIQPGIQSYVNEIGQKMAQYSERQDVQYRFTVLDSPIVNAFALPGGYIYITRGTLSVANSEAELAAVLGHEIGHVAARHQASRYSKGVLTQLGATVLSAAIGVPAVSQAIGLGGNLYMSSYSRGQETQSDQLGVRYLSRAGYDTLAMSNFLRAMSSYHSVEAKATGKPEAQFSYLSSHPDTGGRVQEARAEATKFPPQQQPVIADNRYLSMVRGMPYGESTTQGFERNGTFYHPDIGFAFHVPSSFNIDNKQERIAIEGRDNTILVLDMAKNKDNLRPQDFISRVWLGGQVAQPIDVMDINGLPAATTAVGVTINNQPAEVRLIAMEWGGSDFIRMQILIPRGASSSAVDDLKRISYSFRKMTPSERQSIRPYQIDLVKAGRGDTIETLASEMATPKMKIERFAALNGITPAQPIVTGKMYKVIR